MQDTFYIFKDFLAESLHLQTGRGTVPSMGEECILRQVKEQIAKDESINKLKKEYDALIKLDHQGLAHVIVADFEAAIPVVVLKGNGGDLLSNYYLQEPMLLIEAIKTVMKLAELLEYLHAQGIILQTLQPSDIMLNRNTEHLQLVSLEQKLPLEQRYYSEENKYLLNELLLYMDPVISLRPYSTPDRRSDLYSLGVIFYELVFFRSLFGYSDHKEIISAHLLEEPHFTPSELTTLPPALISLFRMLLAKEPQHRLSNATEVIGELKKILAALSPVVTR
jgi:serine/threonine protein kinase